MAEPADQRDQARSRKRRGGAGRGGGSGRAPIPGLAPRLAALQALERVERDAAFVARLPISAELDERDRRMVTGIVAGVTRHRRWLDFLVDVLYSGDARKLQPRVRQILRMGLHDLLFRDTPAHAAVSQAVELSRAAERPKAAGLINAILREASRKRDAAALPRPETGDAAVDLAIEHSHPTWLVRRWLERFGVEETVALLEADNAAPAFGLRVNTLRASVDEVLERLEGLGAEPERSEVVPELLRVSRLQALISEGLLAEGWGSIQDEAAAMVVQVLDPQPGETVIDLCAAPGGKALMAAARMRDEGRLVAGDRHAGKLALVADAARDQGLSIVETRPGDARKLRKRLDPEDPIREAGADRVLLDAPCSGTGVLAKRADLRWRLRAADLRELVESQDRLLDAAAELVRPGGLLVYATCSLEPEENIERVRAFLARRADFRLESAAPLLSSSRVSSSLVSEDGCLQSLPHLHGMDGAFAARLRSTRADETSSGRDDPSQVDDSSANDAQRTNATSSERETA